MKYNVILKKSKPELITN